MNDPSIEEVRPGIFLKKIEKGTSVRYVRVYPKSWNGKTLWSGYFPPHTLFFLFVMFIAFAYWNDTHAYKDFYQEVASNPQAFCTALHNSNSLPVNLTLGFQSTNVLSNHT